MSYSSEDSPMCGKNRLTRHARRLDSIGCDFEDIFRRRRGRSVGLAATPEARVRLAARSVRAHRWYACERVSMKGTIIYTSERATSSRGGRRRRRGLRRLDAAAVQLVEEFHRRLSHGFFVLIHAIFDAHGGSERFLTSSVVLVAEKYAQQTAAHHDAYAVRGHVRRRRARRRWARWWRRTRRWWARWWWRWSVRAVDRPHARWSVEVLQAAGSTPRRVPRRGANKHLHVIGGTGSSIITPTGDVLVERLGFGEHVQDGSHRTVVARVICDVVCYH